MLQSRKLFFFLFCSFSRNVRLRSKPILKPQKETFSSTTNIKPKENEKLSSQTQNLFNKNPLDKLLSSSENFTKLLEKFNENKPDLSIGNHICFLHHAIRLFSLELNKIKEDIDIKHPPLKKLLDYEELKISLSFIKQNIHKLDGFRTTVFVSKITKIGYYDRSLLEKLVQKILELNVELGLSSLSFIVWAMAKIQYKDDKFLEFVSERIIKAENINLKSQVNLIWGLCELSYSNEKVNKILEGLILQNVNQYDFTSTNLIFGAFSKSRNPNFKILDSLSMNLIKHQKDFTFRNISNLMNYCCSLNYINNILFDHFEAEILRKLKKIEDAIEKYEENELKKIIEEEESKLNEENTKNDQKNTEKMNISEDEEENVLTNNISQEKNGKNMDSHIFEGLEELTPFDASQILISFCKLKIVKPRLFEVLEASFIRMLPIASPTSFTSFAFAHSSLCTDLQLNLQKNKKLFLKRSLKNLKKYNNGFYELCLPFIKKLLPEFTFEQLYSIFLSASRPLVKKRAVCRQLIELGVEGIKLIPAEHMDKEYYEKMLFQHYKVLLNFTYKEEMKKELLEAFQKSKIDFSEVCIKYGYLGDGRIEKELI